MGSKKTVSVKRKTNVKKAAVKSAPKGAKKAKTESEQRARHPHGRVVAEHKSKEALAQALAPALAREDEDAGQIAARLKTASNSQLLRLQAAVETLKSKYGSRAKLIAAISGSQSKDKDYVAKLDKLSLPNLLELARASERRTKSAAA
jgi:hypothetical protein